jgi:radical SAM protein with 4Fe4S-binding SPASM domain
MFPLDQYAGLMDEMGDKIIVLSLWNYGEPLLNPALPEMIRRAREKKIFVMVTTNGTLLKGNMAEDIIASGLNYLKISLDGTTEAGYRRCREKGSFRDVCRNIETFCRLKQKKKSRHPFVDLTFLVMRENEAEMDAARALAHRLGTDRISFRKVDPHYAADPEAVLPEKSARRLPTYSGEKGRRDRVPPCARVWMQSVINSDGRVFPCCLDLKLAHPLGALENGRPFRRIWRGETYRAFRERQIREPEGYAMCRNCHARNFSEDVYIDE